MNHRKSQQVLEFENDDSSSNSSSSNSDSSHPDLLSQVSVYLSEENFQMALVCLQELSSIDPMNCEYLVKLGHICYRLNNNKSAELYYNSALALKNTRLNSEIWFGLGQIYFQMKNYAKCYSAFFCLLSEYPDHEFQSICMMKLGVACKNLGDLTSSEYYLKRCLDRNDLSIQLKIEAKCQLGGLYDLTNNPKQAQIYYYSASKGLKNFRTLTCLAWTFLPTKPNITLEICQKFSSETISEQLDVKFLTVLANLHLGSTEKAKSTLEEIVSVNRQNRVYLQYLAIIYQRLSEFDKAVEVCRRIAEMWPANGIAWMNLGIAFKFTLNKEDSGDCYLKAFEILGFAEYLRLFFHYNNDKACLIPPDFSITDFPLSDDLRFSNQTI